MTAKRVEIISAEDRQSDSISITYNDYTGLWSAQDENLVSGDGKTKIEALQDYIAHYEALCP